ncbi:WD repeat-containing protein 76 [Pelodytes ibericus]
MPFFGHCGGKPDNLWDTTSKRCFDPNDSSCQGCDITSACQPNVMQAVLAGKLSRQNMSEECGQTKMKPGKKSLQEMQETTPTDRKIPVRTTRQSSLNHRAFSPPQKTACRTKRRNDIDLHEEGTPKQKPCASEEKSTARKHPIVMLSRLTQESSDDITTQNHEEESDGASDQERTDLCPYELERLRNIKENAKFLQSLKLLESASGLSSSKKNQNKIRGIKREKKVKVVEETAIRRSTRLQKMDPSGVPMANKPEQLEQLTEEHPMKPAGPLEMIPTNNQVDHDMLENFLNTWKAISQECLSTLFLCLNQQNSNGISEKLQAGDLKRYTASLNGMALQENAVAKVVRDRIFSVAIHPSTSQTIVAAGDKWGQVGLWDLDHQSPDDGVYVFNPHSRPVSCMFFSPSNSLHLFSLSYDGTVRCGDVSRSVFDEVYRDEEDSFSSFDFLSCDAAVLLVSHWDGCLSLVDRRTPGTSCEQQTTLGMRSARTVNVHPIKRDLCVVAGASDVCIYDVRKLEKKQAQPVLSLTGHTKSVASAYFSPNTGSRILTTCADDRIRVYDSSSLNSAAPLLTTLRHNNNTGRWLTRFRAVWDPRQEDCFVVGSMARPRQIEVYHEHGELLHSFWDSEYLGSVCSINAMHPTRNLLAGGNSSGRLHVFRD